ncbi:MAG: three-Cys-motif partner protein TcmP [Candidatus Eremiobacteraeota bacterium]|nr:three-Cys-motif partner protein TcmP [Candidatus Eremiobacteraeota bacterium]
MERSSKSHSFGGDWTEEKLLKVQKYLQEYTKALKNQPFITYYIDAFAGTGYRTVKKSAHKDDLLFPELGEDDTQRFLDGSAKKALKIIIPFSHYIFIEKSKSKAKELEALKDEHPERDIQIVIEDANLYLEKWCTAMGSYDRAVLFLDPFGMEVKWETISHIAQTKKIDMWYLFPAGGVMRHLRRDGKIDEKGLNNLNTIFGDNNWFNHFYDNIRQLGLFGNEDYIVKTADCEALKQFLLKKLKSIFSGVAENPLILCNSNNTPLYILCFAAGNEKGAKVALKIANYILKR